MNKICAMRKNPGNPEFSEFLPRLPPNPYPKPLCKMPKPSVPDISILTDESEASEADCARRHCGRANRTSELERKLCEGKEDARMPDIEKGLQELLRICTASKPVTNDDNSYGSIEGARCTSEFEESEDGDCEHDDTAGFSDDDASFCEESLNCDENEDTIGKNSLSSIQNDRPHFVLGSKRLCKIRDNNCAKGNLSSTSESSDKYIQEFPRTSNISLSSVKGKTPVPIKQSTTFVPEFSFLIPRMQRNISQNRNDSHVCETKPNPKCAHDYTLNGSISNIHRSRKMNSELEFTNDSDDKPSSDTFSVQADSLYEYLSPTTRQYLKKHGVVKQKRLKAPNRLNVRSRLSGIEESESDYLDSLYNELDETNY